MIPHTYALAEIYEYLQVADLGGWLKVTKSCGINLNAEFLQVKVLCRKASYGTHFVY